MVHNNNLMVAGQSRLCIFKLESFENFLCDKDSKKSWQNVGWILLYMYYFARTVLNKSST